MKLLCRLLFAVILATSSNQLCCMDQVPSPLDNLIGVWRNDNIILQTYFHASIDSFTLNMTQLKKTKALQELINGYPDYREKILRIFSLCDAFYEHDRKYSFCFYAIAINLETGQNLVIVKQYYTLERTSPGELQVNAEEMAQNCVKQLRKIPITRPWLKEEDFKYIQKRVSKTTRLVITMQHRTALFEYLKSTYESKTLRNTVESYKFTIDCLLKTSKTKKNKLNSRLKALQDLFTLIQKYLPIEALPPSAGEAYERLESITSRKPGEPVWPGKLPKPWVIPGEYLQPTWIT